MDCPSNIVGNVVKVEVWGGGGGGGANNNLTTMPVAVAVAVPMRIICYPGNPRSCNDYCRGAGGAPGVDDDDGSAGNIRRFNNTSISRRRRQNVNAIGTAGGAGGTQPPLTAHLYRRGGAGAG